MKKNDVITYLIIINLVSFILNTINIFYIRRKKREMPFVFFINLITHLGAGIGGFISEIIFNKDKRYIIAKIYFLLFSAIYIFFFVFFYGGNSIQNTKWFVEKIETHKLLFLYLLAINIITYLAFVLDKIKALLHKWRIRERTLLGLSLIGGSIGALLSMDLFNHKVNLEHHPSFVFGIPIMIVTHIVLIGNLL